MGLEILKYQRAVERSASLVKVAEYSKDLAPGTGDGIHVSMHFDADVAYGIFAVAEDWRNIDMTLSASIMGGLREQILARNEEPDGLPSLWTLLEKPAELRIHIYCPHSRSAPTQVYILVVRVAQ